MASTLLLDMDEVLVDFVGGACRVHGTTREEIESFWPEGHWSVVEPIGASKGIVLTEDRFWETIHKAGRDFWINLEPLPWLSELLKLVNGRSWYIVSAPSRCPSSYDGKVQWLKNYFGARFDRFIISPHKYLLAKPGVMLVDDREKNVDEFIRHGGIGAVFPARSNSRYEWASNPLANRDTFYALKG